MQRSSWSFRRIQQRGNGFVPGQLRQEKKRETLQRFSRRQRALPPLIRTTAAPVPWEPLKLARFCGGMEPIDRRITAVTLLMLREKPHPEQALEALLRVREMAVPDSERTKQEIENFVASGSATAASQLIHAAQVRCPATPTPPATS